MNHPSITALPAHHPEQDEWMAPSLKSLQPASGTAPQGYAAEVQVEPPPYEDMSMNSPCL